jgi:cytochrome c biogenesis protein CcmG/thiol:disulfide interchange protein DsbE
MRKPVRWLLFAVFTLLSRPLWAADAPDFSLPATDGTVKLADLKGQVVYLDFWASWCSPCRKSFPWMNEMQRRYRARGLTVVAVNLDKDRALAQQFLAAMHPMFTIAYDPEGKVASRYDVQAMPSSYLIDRSGRVVSRHLGFREDDKAAMEQTIRALLGKGDGR